MKRLVSLFLTILMLVGVVPSVTAFAQTEWIEIYTADDLRAVEKNLSGNYKLMNDIDLSQVTATGGKYDFNGNGWEPIGSGGVYGNNAFTGVFDGNGYTISGMRLHVTSMPKGASSKTAHIGLFAYNSGLICNLTVDGMVSSVYEYGVPYIGGIVAYNNGNIQNCTNKCSVNMNYNNLSSNFAGGIAGYNKGTITECFNDDYISISGKKSSSAYCVYSAGIACGTGSIYNCYNTGRISSSHNYGAVKAFSGGINACEKTSAAVSLCYNIGNSEYAISNVDSKKSYFLINSGFNYNNCAKMLTEEQMQNADSFVEFDFDSIWCIDNECGYNYPQLLNNRQVEPIIVTGIEIETLPSKLEYTEGEEFDTSGLVVNVLYNNGKKEAVVDYTLSGFESAVGTHTIVVDYSGFSASFDLVVNEKQPLYILGDSDSNQIINIADATQIQLYIAEYEVVESFNFNAADVTKDELLSVLDVTGIQLYIAQYPTDNGIGEKVYD